MIFHHVGLKITAEVKHHTVNFLDVTLNLSDGTYMPYRKPNNEPLYIDSHSNHPPAIVKQLPLSVNRRISSLSSDQQSFNSAAPFYENALRRSNYNQNLQFQPSTEPTAATNRRRRGRNIIWFNPPFSKNVRTNVARNFLRLIDKHFPRSSPFHKIFNRNTVKVSYSCMPNVKSVISQHNHRVLNQQTITPEIRTCNCRDAIQCPLQGNCLAKNIVYKAQVSCTDDGGEKEYIGMTATTFKLRYANHKKSFNYEDHSKDTELSKHVWDLKRSGKSFSIKWSILRRANAFKAGGKRCNLCLDEKLCILLSDRSKTLNKRSEIFGKCRHQVKFSAGNFKRQQRTGYSRQQTSNEIIASTINVPGPVA